MSASFGFLLFLPVDFLKELAKSCSIFMVYLYPLRNFPSTGSVHAGNSENRMRFCSGELHLDGKTKPLLVTLVHVKNITGTVVYRISRSVSQGSNWFFSKTFISPVPSLQCNVLICLLFSSWDAGSFCLFTLFDFWDYFQFNWLDQSSILQICMLDCFACLLM